MSRFRRTVYSALVVIISLAGVTSPVPKAFSAVGEPDLTIAHLEEPPGALSSGESFSSTVEVNNYVGNSDNPAGFSGNDRADRDANQDAVASVVGFHLELPEAGPGETDAASPPPPIPIGTIAIPRLPAHKHARRSGSLTIPDSAPSGDYFMFACADKTQQVDERNEDDNCRRAVGMISITGPSSEMLIEGALERGEITSEEALTYKTLWAFEDPRFPAEYDGDDARVQDAGVLTELAQRFDTLSPETQSMLDPFLIPPQHANSWYYDQPTRQPEAPPVRQTTDPDYETRCGIDYGEGNFAEWAHVDAAGDKVRIWWLKANEATDQERAIKMAKAIDEIIWPKFTTLMRREPIPDIGKSTFCYGGSDAIDISLVDGISASMSGNPLGDCSRSWTRILFNRKRFAVGEKAAISELAHELFHSFQWAYKTGPGCLGGEGEYGWLMEATAEWAEEYAYPDHDTEFPFAKYYLDEPGLSLDSPGSGAVERNRYYGAYLLPFMAAGEGRGRGNVVREMWEATESMSSLEAMRSPFLKAPFGDFDRLWKDFALFNWNQGSVDHYKDWDGMFHGAVPLATRRLTSQDNATIPVPHVASEYVEYTFDLDLTRVEISNPQSGTPGAGLQALISYADGTQRVVDWSSQANIVLCLDDPGVEKIVLIFSNSNITGPEIVFTPKLVGIGVCNCTGDTPFFARSASPESAESCIARNTIVFKRSRHETASDDSGRYSLSHENKITMHLKLRWIPEKDQADVFGGKWVDDGSSWTAVGHWIEINDWRDSSCVTHIEDERTWSVSGVFGGSISPRPNHPDYTKPGASIQFSQIFNGPRPTRTYILDANFGIPTVRKTSVSSTGEDCYSEAGEEPDRIFDAAICGRPSEGAPNGNGVLEGRASKKRPRVVKFNCFRDAVDDTESTGTLVLRR